MPAKSKAQQRFFGMVHAKQKGELPGVDGRIAEVAKSIDPDEAAAFASTKTDKLPERVKEAFVLIPMASPESQLEYTDPISSPFAHMFGLNKTGPLGGNRYLIDPVSTHNPKLIERRNKLRADVLPSLLPFVGLGAIGGGMLGYHTAPVPDLVPGLTGVGAFAGGTLGMLPGAMLGRYIAAKKYNESLKKDKKVKVRSYTPKEMSQVQDSSDAHNFITAGAGAGGGLGFLAQVLGQHGALGSDAEHFSRGLPPLAGSLSGMLAGGVLGYGAHRYYKSKNHTMHKKEASDNGIAIQEAFLTGFLKAAADKGLGEAAAFELLKKAGPFSWPELKEQARTNVVPAFNKTVDNLKTNVVPAFNKTVDNLKTNVAPRIGQTLGNLGTNLSSTIGNVSTRLQAPMWMPDNSRPAYMTNIANRYAEEMQPYSNTNDALRNLKVQNPTNYFPNIGNAYNSGMLEREPTILMAYPGSHTNSPTGPGFLAHEYGHSGANHILSSEFRGDLTHKNEDKGLANFVTQEMKASLAGRQILGTNWNANSSHALDKGLSTYLNLNMAQNPELKIPGTSPVMRSVVPTQDSNMGTTNAFHGLEDTQNVAHNMLEDAWKRKQEMQVQAQDPEYQRLQREEYSRKAQRNMDEFLERRKRLELGNPQYQYPVPQYNDPFDPYKLLNPRR